MEEHVNSVLSGCASNLYALNTLRAHGLQGEELEEIYRAKILSKIMYGSPAWWGYCSVDTCNRINSFLKKGKNLESMATMLIFLSLFAAQPMTNCSTKS